MEHKTEQPARDILLLVKEATHVVKELNELYRDEILKKAVEKLPALFDISYVFVFLYQMEENTLVLQNSNLDVAFAERILATDVDHLLGTVLLRGTPLFFEKAENSGCACGDLAPYLENYCAVLPMLVGQGVEKETIGILVLAQRNRGVPFSEMEENLAVQLSEVLTHCIARTQPMESSKMSAMMDNLTDTFLWNPFYEYFAREVYRSKRYRCNLALLILRIDDIEQLDERFSEGAGDYVLQETAHLVHKTLRSVDLVARRIDTFFTILPETKINDAMIVAERLRKSFKQRRFQHNGKEVAITASFGLVECCATDTPVSLMNKGRLSLEHARKEGGDQIAVYHVMQEAAGSKQ